MAASCSNNYSILQKRASALLEILKEMMGTEKVILKAGQVNAIPLLESKELEDQLLGLKRIIYDDPTIAKKPLKRSMCLEFADLTDKLAEKKARVFLERELDEKANAFLQKRQDEFLQDLRNKMLIDKMGLDNAQTLKKYAKLEYLEEKKITTTNNLNMLKPKNLDEIIGQEKAVQALLTKIASPFPQHIILYGPPGVGKTTAARLALEAAKGMSFTPFREDAEFVEADGSTLRWDPRESSNPLLGSVHDPIYQGARLSYAEESIPEPKLGLVTDAHGGVLFIDEIGEMDLILQNKLLKVLEDKRVSFHSSYYDLDNPRVPKYIKKLFEDGAPADFILIGATTRLPHELSPAIRSRTTEIFFEPLLPEHIEEIVNKAANRLKVNLGKGVGQLIASYTSEGRKAINILADAYGLALYDAQKQNKVKKQITICKEDVLQAVCVSRIVPKPRIALEEKPETGKIYGLGVSGFLGSLLEIEAIAFPKQNKEKGILRLNDTAGSMTKDALFNAGCVLRKVAGIDFNQYDLYVNFIGGGLVNGPSAGVALFVALYSAIKQIPIPQNIAITGELSIQGKVKPVGGIPEKLFAAKQAGIKKVYFPQENLKEIPNSFQDLELEPLARVEDIITSLFKMK